MGFLDRLLGRKATAEPTPQAVVASIKEHLLRIHQHFKSSRNYAASAPYWRELEAPGVLDFLNKCFDGAQGKRGVVTQTRRGHQGLLICTVIDAVEPGQIRSAFAPSGYLSHLEEREFFHAPQKGIPAIAFLLGHEASRLRVDLSWFPPLDGKAYQVVVAQDILTPRERQELGI